MQLDTRRAKRSTKKLLQKIRQRDLTQYDIRRIRQSASCSVVDVMITPTTQPFNDHVG